MTWQHAGEGSGRKGEGGAAALGLCSVPWEFRSECPVLDRRARSLPGWRGGRHPCFGQRGGGQGSTGLPAGCRDPKTLLPARFNALLKAGMKRRLSSAPLSLSPSRRASSWRFSVLKASRMNWKKTTKITFLSFPSLFWSGFIGPQFPRAVSQGRGQHRPLQGDRRVGCPLPSPPLPGPLLGSGSLRALPARDSGAEVRGLQWPGRGCSSPPCRAHSSLPSSPSPWPLASTA